MMRMALLPLILSPCAGSDLFAQDQKTEDSIVVVDAQPARSHQDSAQISAPTDAPEESPAKASVCHIEADPGAYKHKLVEVTGFVEIDWEGFLLTDSACPDKAIFLEAGFRGRGPLIIEGFLIPFVEDSTYRQFKEIAYRPPDRVVRATLLGRFFGGSAPESECKPDGELLCPPALPPLPFLGVQQILAVEPQDRGDLDYGIVWSHPNSPKLEPGCGFRTLQEDALGEMIQAQKTADDNGPDWVLNDPQRVATEELAGLLKTDAALITLRLATTEQGRFVYDWTEKYRVVVSRPYLLTFYARDPMKIAWVVAAAYESGCGDGPLDVSAGPIIGIPE